MKDKFKKLKVRQFDKKFQTKTFVKDIVIPQAGWIREIRMAIGMSHRQLANRMGVSAPTVAKYEKSEAEGKISIETLKKVTKALNCKFVYAIVPTTSLNKIIKEQILKVAGTLFKRVSHTMSLEQQGLNNKENREQLKDLVDEVNSNMNKKIWDYEI
jgi:predicted DNA-binding mobile mystery protein A